MLRKYSNSRTLSDNLKLGSLTAFAAGMVNIGSLMIFFAFSSNVTGHYAILASEIVKGNVYQVAVVFAWIFLFFFGSFTSNYIVIHTKKQFTLLGHSLPIVLEIACLFIVGIYGQYFYQETLTETEALLCLMLFAMGLQNGLTASISNSKVKTTHLTGATTDLGMLVSMLTKKEFRAKKEIRDKTKLLSVIASSYLAGGIFAGFVYLSIGFKMFYVACGLLVCVIIYDVFKIFSVKFQNSKRRELNNSQQVNRIRSESKKEIPAY
jgi:uncharacterized membrane protein YoaK (UPF0700 family)